MHTLKWWKRDADEETYVIFSLSVTCKFPIEALAPLRIFTVGNTTRMRAENDIFYDLGRASFEDGNWDTRADKLEKIVNDALDRLAATGVDPEPMRRPDVLLKAFFTFGSGAETISAAVVERLARYHATIWIDA